MLELILTYSLLFLLFNLFNTSFSILLLLLIFVLDEYLSFSSLFIDGLLSDSPVFFFYFFFKII
jgi:hypothetical protein